MFRGRVSGRQLGKWLQNYILLHLDENCTVGKKVKVIRELARLPDGSVVKKTTDGWLTISTVFQSNALEEAFQKYDGEEPNWRDALLILKEFKITFQCTPKEPFGEYILVVKKFSVWDLQEGFSLKYDLTSCMWVPEIRALAAEERKTMEAESQHRRGEFDHLLDLMTQYSQNQGVWAGSDDGGDDSPPSEEHDAIGDGEDRSATRQERQPADTDRVKGPLDEDDDDSIPDSITKQLMQPFTTDEFVIPESQLRILEALSEWHTDHMATSSSRSGSLSMEQNLRLSALSTSEKSSGAKRGNTETPRAGTSAVDTCRTGIRRDTTVKPGTSKQLEEVIDSQIHSQVEASAWQDNVDSVQFSDESSMDNALHIDEGSDQTNLPVGDVDKMDTSEATNTQPQTKSASSPVERGSSVESDRASLVICGAQELSPVEVCDSSPSIVVISSEDSTQGKIVENHVEKMDTSDASDDSLDFGTPLANSTQVDSAKPASRKRKRTSQGKSIKNSEIPHHDSYQQELNETPHEESQDTRKADRIDSVEAIKGSEPLHIEKSSDSETSQNITLKRNNKMIELKNLMQKFFKTVETRIPSVHKSNAVNLSRPEQMTEECEEESRLSDQGDNFSRMGNGAEISHNTGNGALISHNTGNGAEIYHNTENGAQLSHNTENGAKLSHNTLNGAELSHNTWNGAEQSHNAVNGAEISHNTVSSSGESFVSPSPEVDLTGASQLSRSIFRSALSKNTSKTDAATGESNTKKQKVDDSGAVNVEHSLDKEVTASTQTENIEHSLDKELTASTQTENIEHSLDKEVTASTQNTDVSNVGVVGSLEKIDSLATEASHEDEETRENLERETHDDNRSVRENSVSYIGINLVVVKTENPEVFDSERTVGMTKDVEPLRNDERYPGLNLKSFSNISGKDSTNTEDDVNFIKHIGGGNQINAEKEKQTPSSVAADGCTKILKSAPKSNIIGTRKRKIGQISDDDSNKKNDSGIDRDKMARVHQASLLFYASTQPFEVCALDTTTDSQAANTLSQQVPFAVDPSSTRSPESHVYTGTQPFQVCQMSTQAFSPELSRNEKHSSTSSEELSFFKYSIPNNEVNVVSDTGSNTRNTAMSMDDAPCVSEPTDTDFLAISGRVALPEIAKKSVSDSALEIQKTHGFMTLFTGRRTSNDMDTSDRDGVTTVKKSVSDENIHVSVPDGVKLRSCYIDLSKDNLLTKCRKQENKTVDSESVRASKEAMTSEHNHLTDYNKKSNASKQNDMVTIDGHYSGKKSKIPFYEERVKARTEVMTAELYRLKENYLKLNTANSSSRQLPSKQNDMVTFDGHYSGKKSKIPFYEERVKARKEAMAAEFNRLKDYYKKLNVAKQNDIVTVDGYYSGKKNQFPLCGAASYKEHTSEPKQGVSKRGSRNSSYTGLSKSLREEVRSVPTPVYRWSKLQRKYIVDPRVQQPAVSSQATNTQQPAASSQTINTQQPAASSQATNTQQSAASSQTTNTQQPAASSQATNTQQAGGILTATKSVLGDWLSKCTGAERRRQKTCNIHDFQRSLVSCGLIQINSSEDDRCSIDDRMLLDSQHSSVTSTPETASQETQTPSFIEETSAQMMPVEKKQTQKLPVKKTQTQKFPVEIRQTQKLPVEKLQTQNLPMEKTVIQKLPVEKIQIQKLQVEKTQKQKLPVEKTQIQKLPVEKTQIPKLPVEKTQTPKLPVEKIQMQKLQVEKTQKQKLPVEKTQIQKLPVEKTQILKSHKEKSPMHKLPQEKTPTQKLPEEKTPTEKLPEKTPAEDSPEETLDEDSPEKTLDEDSLEETDSDEADENNPLEMYLKKFMTVFSGGKSGD